MDPSPKGKGREFDSNEPQPQPSIQQSSDPPSQTSKIVNSYTRKPVEPPCCPWPFKSPFQRQYSTIPLELRLPRGRTQPSRFDEDLEKALELLVPVQRQAFERATEVPGLVNPLEAGAEANNPQNTDLPTTFKDILKVSTRDLARLVETILSRKRSMDANAATPEASQENTHAQDRPSQQRSQTNALGPTTRVVAEPPQGIASNGVGQLPPTVHNTSLQLDMLNSSCPLVSLGQPSRSNIQYGYGQAQQSFGFSMNSGQMNMNSQLGLGSFLQSSGYSMNTGQVGILGAETENTFTSSSQYLGPAPQILDGQSQQPSQFSENSFNKINLQNDASEIEASQSLDPMLWMHDGQSQQISDFPRTNLEANMIGVGANQNLMASNPSPIPHTQEASSGQNTMFQDPSAMQQNQPQRSFVANFQQNMMGGGSGQNPTSQIAGQVPQMLGEPREPPPQSSQAGVVKIFSARGAHLHISGYNAVFDRPFTQPFTHILNVTQEQLTKKQLKPFKDQRRYVVASLSPEGDFRKEHIDAIATIGRDVFEQSGQLLVHDTHGRNRAPTAIMIILMKCLKMRLNDALNFVVKNMKIHNENLLLSNDISVNLQYIEQDMLAQEQVQYQQNGARVPAYQDPIQHQGQQASAPPFYGPWPINEIGKQKQQDPSPQKEPSDVLSPPPVPPIADQNIQPYSVRVPQSLSDNYVSPYHQPTPAPEPAPIQRSTPTSQPKVSPDPNIDPLLQNQLCAPVDLVSVALEQGAGQLLTPSKPERDSEPSQGKEGSSNQTGDLFSGYNARNSPADADSAQDSPLQAEQVPRGQAGPPQSQATQRNGQGQNHPSPPDYTLINVFNEVVTTNEFRQLSVYISCSGQDVAPAKRDTYVLDLDPDSSPYQNFPNSLRPEDKLNIGDFERFVNRCISSSGVLLIHSSREDACLGTAAGVAFYVLCKFGKWEPERAMARLKSRFVPPSPGDIKDISQSLRLRVPASVHGENILQLRCKSSNSVQSRVEFPPTPMAGRKRASDSLPGGSMPSPAKRRNLEDANSSINDPHNVGQDSQMQSPPKYGFPEHAIRGQYPRSKKHQDPKPGAKDATNSPPGSDGQEEKEKRKRGRPKGSRNKTRHEQDAAGSPSPSTGGNEPAIEYGPTTSLTPDQRKGEPRTKEKAAGVETVLHPAEANKLTAYLVPHLVQRSANAQSQGIPQPIVEASEQGAIQAVSNEVNPPPPSRSRLLEGVGIESQICYDNDRDFANLPSATQRARRLGLPDPYGPLAFQAIVLDGEHAQRGLIAEHQQRGNVIPLFRNPIKVYGPGLDEAYAVMNTLPPQPQPVPAVPNPPRPQGNAIRNRRSIFHAPGPSREMNPSPSSSDQSTSLSPPIRPALHAEANHTNPFAPAAPGSMARFVQQALDGQPLLPPVENAETFRNNFPREEYQMTAYAPAPWEMEYAHDDEY